VHPHTHWELGVDDPVVEDELRERCLSEQPPRRYQGGRQGPNPKAVVQGVQGFFLKSNQTKKIIKVDSGYAQQTIALRCILKLRNPLRCKACKILNQSLFFLHDESSSSLDLQDWNVRRVEQPATPPRCPLLSRQTAKDGAIQEASS
jgi:hypothetical protein